MKNNLIILLAIWLAGCAHIPDARYVTQPQIQEKRSKVAIHQLANEIAFSLSQDSVLIASDGGLLVTAPVFVEDFNQTSFFSSVLQQSLMSALTKIGVQVLDINVADAVRVTKKGALILTRDWQRIPSNLSVGQVLVSTISLNKSGMLINSRIVNTSNNEVVVAVQSQVSANELNDYLAPAEKIVVKDGVIFRNSQQAQGRVKQIGMD
ncbi:MAG: FlgO family outer membrane protein [Parashewanella sp.]